MAPDDPRPRPMLARPESESESMADATFGSAASSAARESGHADSSEGDRLDAPGGLEDTRSWQVALWEWWTGPRAAAARAVDDNLVRLMAVFALLALLNLAHVVLLQRAIAPNEVRGLWRSQLVGLHGGMAPLAVGVGIGLMLLLRWKSPLSLVLRRVAEALACGVGIGFAMLVVMVDQLVTSNITPFLVACLAGAALLRLRPGVALLLYATAGAAFWWAMGQSQPDAQMRLSNQVNGLTVVSVSWLVSVSLWQARMKVERLLHQLRSSHDYLQRQQQRLRQLAVRDALTHTWNRSEFRRLAERELALGQRHQCDTSLILLDLDRFKHINDAWGHPVGDAVLVAAARVLRDGVRGSDEVGRLGGEEFVILLPQTGLEAAQALAERLRHQLEVLQVAPVDVPITASFGVASLPGWPRCPVGDAFERLYSAADTAVYAAKRRGRNRVELADPILLA